MISTEIGTTRSRRRRAMLSFLPITILASLLHTTGAYEDSYLSEVKSSCFKRGDVLSCIKYKALRLMTSTVFSPGYANETAIYGTNGAVSVVRMDDDLFEESAHFNEVDNFAMLEEGDTKRGYQSEWMKLARYAFLQAKSFLGGKGLKVELPEGSRTYEVEEKSADASRGKKKKLAILLPLLSLLAILKVKLLLLPILLAVIFIKKLLIIAALLLPSLFSTLKMCKMPQMNHGHWASADSTPDFSSAGYGASYSYGGGASSGNGAGYGKDWAASRAYNAQRARQGQAAYIVSGGNGIFAEAKTK